MKEIFVLGAGASHASAGTPLGKDLVWRYYQECSGIDDSEKDKRHFESLLSFLKTKPEFKEYHDSLKEMMDTQYIWELNVDKRHYVDELMEDLQKRNNYNTIKLIKELTVKHITESSNGKGNQLYRELGHLLSKKSASEVCVISLNFDCWLSEDIKKKVRFDYLLKFDEIDTSREFYKANQGTGIPLIKLNGSLDWAFNPTTKKIKLLHKNIRPDTDYYNGASSDGKAEPYIFLPHQDKDELIKPLWDRAKTELKQASKATIIGYSFPDCDKDMIELFRFRENVAPAIALEVVDLARSSNEQEGIKTKYKKLFPNITEVKFCFNGFEGYLEQLKSVVI